MDERAGHDTGEGHSEQGAWARYQTKGMCCWLLRLEKLSKSLSKIMIAAEGVESKHSTSLKHQE